MKQIVQSLSSGKTQLVVAPTPALKAGHLVVDTSASLISAGTERMLVEFSRGSLVSKARSQPDKVKQVLDKVRTDGLLPTYDAVRSKINDPLPLGYSNVGVVRAVGKGVKGFHKHDRVVSNGPHATRVQVAQNLCVKIPDAVSNETASFTVLGAIALQGLRLASPTLGECFVVTGAGSIGLLTVQLLMAQGCRVLAIDIDKDKLKLAESFGAQTLKVSSSADVVKAAIAFSRGAGVDGVIITASTKSDLPVNQAAQMCRRRGRIVLVGVTGLKLNRADFYEKEISFQVSCSYGPGRYDPFYEEQGHDYPLGFVRWTEKRNFEAVLDMMASGKLAVEGLLTHRFRFEDAEAAYDALLNEKSAIGVLLQYDDQADTPIEPQTLSLHEHEQNSAAGSNHPVCGFIGAGNYADRILIPAFRKAGARLHTLAAPSGLNASIRGDQAGFEFAASDIDAVFENSAINTIVIATRHDSHARLTQRALEKDMNVFTEKPLALSQSELTQVKSAYETAQAKGRNPKLMVGFNRRFAPHVVKARELLKGAVQPSAFVMTVNAGHIGADHWTQDEKTGGGRILGEACHFIDLLRHLAGASIAHVSAQRLGNTPTRKTSEDVASITLRFSNGCLGTIHYFANGPANLAKERLEIFADGGVLQLDNYRRLRGISWPGFRSMRSMRQDKGQEACAAAFLKSIAEQTPSPIPPDELFDVARATIAAADQLRSQ